MFLTAKCQSAVLTPSERESSESQRNFEGFLDCCWYYSITVATYVIATVEEIHSLTHKTVNVTSTTQTQACERNLIYKTIVLTRQILYQMVLGFPWGSPADDDKPISHIQYSSTASSSPHLSSSDEEGSHNWEPTNGERLSLLGNTRNSPNNNQQPQQQPQQTYYDESMTEEGMDDRSRRMENKTHNVRLVPPKLSWEMNNSNHNHHHHHHENGMDDSCKSNYSGVASLAAVENLRDTLKNLRSLSHQSITTSVRQSMLRMTSVIQEHTGSIGMLGSLSIAINNLTGPAMLSLPATYARSGIIPTTLTLVFVCILSSFCSLHMASVISKVPNNQDFKQGVEFPEAFQTFWGKRWFVAANWLFFGCITCLNVSSLVDNAQVLDTFLGHCNPYGGAWALAMDPVHKNATFTSWDPSVCSEQTLYEGGCIPFATTKEEDEDVYILTIGYVVTAVAFFPLAMMDLTENVQWQILGFGILLITSVQFIVTFAMSDLDASHLSWWGHSYDSLLGVILFNFALVITVPAWLYEKEPHVDIPTVMHTSTITSTVLYILIGILGCLAMPDVSDNFLESIMSGALGPSMQIGASIFAFFIIGLNIPLFSILTRLSLLGGGNESRASCEGNQFCSRPVANLLAVYLPFGLSWTLYQGSKVTALLNWGGMFFTSLVSFLLPLALALYVVTTKFEEYKGSVKIYPWNFSDRISSKESQIFSLRILLCLSAVAVVVAIAGNFYASVHY